MNEKVRYVGIAFLVGLVIGAGGILAIFQTGSPDSKAIISSLEAENIRLKNDLKNVQGRIDFIASGIGKTRGRIDTISTGIGGGIEGLDAALEILEELGDLVVRIEKIIAGDPDPESPQ